MKDIIDTGNITMLSLALDSLPIPLTSFSFENCPCPVIIDTILSHYTQKEILEMFKQNKQGANEKSKNKKKKNTSSPVTSGHEQKNKEYLRNAVESIREWNKCQTCVVASPLHIAARKNAADEIAKTNCF